MGIHLIDVEAQTSFASAFDGDFRAGYRRRGVTSGGAGGSGHPGARRKRRGMRPIRHERDDGVVSPMMNGIGGDLFVIV